MYFFPESSVFLYKNVWKKPQGSLPSLPPSADWRNKYRVNPIHFPDDDAYVDINELKNSA